MRWHCFRFGLVMGSVLGMASLSVAEDAPPVKEPRSRTFLFSYQATLAGLPAGKAVRVWLPVPASNEDQDVEIVFQDVPIRSEFHREPQYGNQILYVEGKSNGDAPLTLTLTYRVTRREVKGDMLQQPKASDKLARFLKPDALVPVGGKPLELLKGKDVPMDQMAAAKLFYDVVNQHMRYSKDGAGWGRGDAVWACDSRFGNCSDFHSLFISLARAAKIPAKFEIGFPLPEKHGDGEIPGYHCWAKFRPDGKGWIPVDISEANKNPRMTEYYFGNLTEDRVAFSVGRDLTLVPKQDGDLINFLIYPYVEVDGKPVPAEKIGKKFTFKDLAERGK
jgi:transglutaminase-like putative cysteine protease